MTLLCHYHMWLILSFYFHTSNSWLLKPLHLKVYSTQIFSLVNTNIATLVNWKKKILFLKRFKGPRVWQIAARGDVHTYQNKTCTIISHELWWRKLVSGWYNKFYRIDNWNTCQEFLETWKLVIWVNSTLALESKITVLTLFWSAVCLSLSSPTNLVEKRYRTEQKRTVSNV